MAGDCYLCAGMRDQIIRILVGKSGGGKARRLLRAWPVWERLAHRIWPAEQVPESPHDLLSIHFKKHNGRTVSLPDATSIVRGDWVGEMHFNNHAIVNALSDGTRQQTGTAKWQIVPMVRAELRALTAWLQSGSMPHEIKAIVGVTVLGRGAVRIGFTMRPRGGKILPYLDKLFVDGLLIIYTPEGVERMTTGTTFRDRSEEAWMSVGELMRRYGT